MSVRDKMNLGSFCGHVANGRVTEIINKIIMRTSEHRHDQAIAFRFPSFQSDACTPTETEQNKDSKNCEAKNIYDQQIDGACI